MKRGAPVNPAAASSLVMLSVDSNWLPVFDGH